MPYLRQGGNKNGGVEMNTKKTRRCGARENMRFSLNPQEVTKRLWYYEETGGLNIVHEIIDGKEDYIRTDQIIIPWAMIRQSLKRKDRK